MTLYKEREIVFETNLVEPLGWRWRRELHGRVWVGGSKVKDRGCSWNLEWKVSNELYLREDGGMWLEEMIQSSSSSDSQKAIGVDYSQHCIYCLKFKSDYNSLKFRLLYESKFT